MYEHAHVTRSAKSSIFDEPIPNGPPPVLQPTPWSPSNVTPKDKQNITQNINDFGEWLLNYIPPKPKVVDKVLESFKKLTTDASRMLVSRAVLSRIDYCNCIFAGLPDFNLDHLQQVMNAAARVISRRRKNYQISDVL